MVVDAFTVELFVSCVLGVVTGTTVALYGMRRARTRPSFYTVSHHGQPVYFGARFTTLSSALAEKDRVQKESWYQETIWGWYLGLGREIE